MNTYDLFKAKSIKYLLVGGFNTICGYSLGVGLYLFLSEIFHTAIIAAIGNFFAISLSFVTYKLFVFKTTGDWASEYFRSFVVYGILALFSIFILWLFVDLLGIQIWWAQAFVVLITMFFSYFLHTRFTFKRQ
jgi:putative flippase GtrA